MSPTNVDRRPVWSSVLKQQGQGPYCFLLRKDGELEILDSTCSSMWTAGSAILDRPSNPDGSCKTYTTTLGDTCDIVAESYGLNLAAFLRYNKDTNCAAGLATGSVVCLTVGTMPSLAPSLKVKEPYVIWVRALSGTVLEINDGKVVVAKSRPTFAMQEWRLEPVAIGKPGQYRLIDMETAHCIYESQMNIVAGECRPSLQAKAEFYVVYVMEDNPSTSSTYLRHVASGKCLEVVFSESIASLALGECKMGVSPSQVFGLTTASSLRTTCISHVVIQGDDCESVSALYNTSSSSLEYFNRISCGGPLRVGQHLCVTEGTYPSSKLKKDPSKEACDGRQVSSNLGTCIDMAEECGISFGSFTLLNRDVVDCSKPLSSNAIQSPCTTLTELACAWTERLLKTSRVSKSRPAHAIKQTSWSNSKRLAVQQSDRLVNYDPHRPTYAWSIFQTSLSCGIISATFQSVKIPHTRWNRLLWERARR
ncbi:hypothetical protein BC829DRAFT_119599 [Chytridium lagenaria]|nr:hypothetical protein BC829DRAFT_119599 [Chytridium lagenaria]